MAPSVTQLVTISSATAPTANALGVGPGYVQRNEYVTEAWYGWQTTPWLNLKLDAQYVICPGGYTTPTNRNAFALGARTTIAFW